MHAHKGQILPLVNQMIPIDKTTTFHASYDQNLHGLNQGTRIAPIGNKKAYLFNGVDSRVVLPMGKGANPYTQKIDIKMRASLTNLKDQILLASDRTGNSQSRLYIGVLSGRWTLAAGSSGWSASDTVVATTGEWVELHLIAEKGTAVLYVNGIETGSRSYGSYTIGDFGLGWNNGYLDYVAASLMSDLEIKVDGKTLGNYPMDEEKGPVAFDVSSNGNDGVWVGGLTTAHAETVATLKNGEGKFGGAVLVEPDTKNVILNTDWSNWSLSYNKAVLYDDIAPPPGVNSKVISFLDSAGNGNGYLFCYGDYAPQIPDTTYTISVWVMTEAPLVLSAYTADNSEVGRQYTETKEVLPAIEWQRVVFSAITTPTTSTSDSLSFRFNVIAPEKRVWMCAPQMEPRSTATSYVQTERPPGRLWYPSSVINQKGFTVSHWFKIPSMHKTSGDNRGVGGNWHHPLIEIAPPSGTGNLGYSIVAGPDASSFNRSLLLRANGDTGSSLSIEDNRWYHLTATCDGAVHKVYIDGELIIHTQRPVLSLPQDSVVMIGGGYQGKPHLLVDEVRIEARVISEEEIAAWAAAGLHYNFLDYSVVAD